MGMGTGMVVHPNNNERVILISTIMMEKEVEVEAEGGAKEG